jgi:integrase
MGGSVPPEPAVVATTAGSGEESPGWSPGQLRAVAGAQAAAVSAATVRACVSDWGRFERWCAATGCRALPATAGTVGEYLVQASRTVDAGGRPAYAAATLRRWSASIAAVHRRHGHSSPAADPRLGQVMSGIARARGTRQRRVAPLLLDDVRAVLAAMDHRTWPAAVASARDAVVVLVGFAAALRRSELAALTLEDLTLVPADGVHLLVARSKTDQEGAGHVKALPYGTGQAAWCPPCVLRRWTDLLTAADDADHTGAPVGSGQRRAVMRHLTQAPPPDRHLCRGREARSEYRFGAGDGRSLLRPVTKGGRVGAAGMSGHAVNAVIKRRVAAAGLDPALFGGHSLRAGFVTQAFRSGADAAAVRRQSGHTGDAVLEVYRREAAPLVGNAVTGLGL